MFLRLAPAALIAASALFGAPPDAGLPSPAASGNDMPVIAGSGVSSDPVGAGDLIYVFVADYPAISRNYRISQTGSISIPALREPLAVAGFTPAAIEKVVRQALLEAQYELLRSARTPVVVRVKTSVNSEAVG